MRARTGAPVAVLLLLAASGPAASQPASPIGAQPALAAALEAARSLAPPGASVAVVRGRRSEIENFGNEWTGGPAVTERTVFQIASLTKPFTAIVVLRLAEERRLSLDDRASRWLPWLPASYHAVTIRQLLNHTSGVPRDLRRENVDEFTIAEFRRRLLAAQPSFAPGAKWEYSNPGYTLLSLIAEQAGGAAFGSLLSRYIFRPLGMTASRYRAPLAKRPGRAVGYDLADGKWQAAPPVYSGFGNSGIETNVRDLARFASALQARQLLSAKSYREMLTSGTLANGEPVAFPFRGAPSSYGLGWFLSTICNEPVAIHGGTIAGFSSNLSWSMRRRVAVMALSNGKSGADRIGIADKIAQAALKAELACPKD